MGYKDQLCGWPPKHVHTHVETEQDHHCQQAETLDKVRFEHGNQHHYVAIGELLRIHRYVCIDHDDWENACYDSLEASL